VCSLNDSLTGALHSPLSKVNAMVSYQETRSPKKVKLASFIPLSKNLSETFSLWRLASVIQMTWSIFKA
jgi:hypothetical protein